MALTSAQKQARYRQTHLIDGDQKRLQLIVSFEAMLGLQRLAKHRGATQASVVEDLLLAEKNRVTGDMNDEEHRRFVGE